MNDKNFFSPGSEILKDNPVFCLSIDVISLDPELGPGGVRVEVCEAAVPSVWGLGGGSHGTCCCIADHQASPES